MLQCLVSKQFVLLDFGKLWLENMEMVNIMRVRPVLMYVPETWALKKAQENKLEVAEMRMLRWMCGVTKLDKIRNERKRGTTKVWEITKKIQERRLKWCWHVIVVS